MSSPDHRLLSRNPKGREMHSFERNENNGCSIVQTDNEERS
jgi:hypothetical protein